MSLRPPTLSAGPLPAQTSFPRDRLEMIRRIEARHFWFGPREKLLQQTLHRHCTPGATILDLGCGSGRWVRQLKVLGHAVRGTDIWPGAPEGLAPEEYAPGTAEALPWPDASADAITLLDTLEHVDDLAALRECHRVLRPHGILLVSVPAFPALWSRRDTRAGHRRRYTRTTLATALGQGGFELHQLFGYQFLLLPLLWVSRRLARFKSGQLEEEESPAPWLNRTLRLVNEFEVWAGRMARPPFGSSLIAVGRKRPA